MIDNHSQGWANQPHVIGFPFTELFTQCSPQDRYRRMRGYAYAQGYEPVLSPCRAYAGNVLYDWSVDANSPRARYRRGLAYLRGYSGDSSPRGVWWDEENDLVVMW